MRRSVLVLVMLAAAPLGCGPKIPPARVAVDPFPFVLDALDVGELVAQSGGWIGMARGDVGGCLAGLSLASALKAGRTTLEDDQAGTPGIPPLVWDVSGCNVDRVDGADVKIGQVEQSMIAQGIDRVRAAIGRHRDGLTPCAADRIDAVIRWLDRELWPAVVDEANNPDGIVKVGGEAFTPGLCQ